METFSKFFNFEDGTLDRIGLGDSVAGHLVGEVAVWGWDEWSWFGKNKTFYIANNEINIPKQIGWPILHNTPLLFSFTPQFINYFLKSKAVKKSKKCPIQLLSLMSARLPFPKAATCCQVGIWPWGQKYPVYQVTLMRVQGGEDSFVFGNRPILILLSYVYKHSEYKVQKISMPQSLLNKKIKTFNLIRVLGQGAFSIVFQAINETDSSIVAVKVTNVKQLNRSKKLRELVQTEITVLKSCKNDNVIRYVDSFETSEFLFIVTEFCNGGDLDQLIAKKNIPEDIAVGYLCQILNGFKGLHEVGAMHRDFKAANILLNDGVCKIADLGFSKQMEQTSIAKTILGTSLTMAPQVLQQTPYTFSADIWSIGVVFYQMIYGIYPYNGPNDFVLLKNIKTNKPNFEGINISRNARDFIQRCLTINPAKRITWKQIYKHPLIQQREGKTLTPGILKSKISLNKNIKFYEQTQFLSERASVNLIESAKRITVQMLPDQQLLFSSKMQYVVKQAKIIKTREELAQRFDNLYISRRNDLMFFAKFIQPYIPSFEHLRVNHSLAAFVLAKKSYTQLRKLHESMKNARNIFYSKQGFEQYTKLENYQKVMKQLETDMQTMQKTSNSYKDKIGLTTKEITQELADIQVIKCPNYDGLVDDVIGDYSRLLVEMLQVVDGQVKTNIIRTVEAINYFRGNQRPSALEFDRIVSTIDFRHAEATLRKKYGFS